MKALSVQQPWAWLLTNNNPATGDAWKPVENRSWATSYRGDLLIHAGLKVDKEGYLWVSRNFPEIPLPSIGSLQRGGIVGKVTQVDCVTRMRSSWFSGPYGHVMKNGAPLPFFACKGQLGYFDVNIPRQ